MEIAEVQDRKSLERYLNALPIHELNTISIALSCRSSTRVLPIAVFSYAEEWIGGRDDLRLIRLFGVALHLMVGVSDDISGNSSNLAIDVVSKLVSRPNPSAVDSAANALIMAQNVFRNVKVNAARRTLSYNTAFVIHHADLAARSVSLWKAARSDVDGNANAALWHSPIPLNVAQAWSDTKDLLSRDKTADWSFWIAWYERLLIGRDILPDALIQILNTLTEDDWQKGPAHINPMFDGVLTMYRAEDAKQASPLTNAAPVDFTFDTLAKVMRMIGLDNTTAHLRQPDLVQTFLDDAEQLREQLQDFADYAARLSGGGNYAGVLQLGVEKVLREFDRTEDLTHIRAERVVTLASDLEIFAKEEKARNDLGESLASRLDSRIDELKRLCRAHFGPSYAVLAPLAELNFDHVDREEVVGIIDDAIEKIDALPFGGAFALDAEGRAVLHDMRRELDDFRAAIAEASRHEFKAVLMQRMAHRTGGLGLTLIRFAERSGEVSGGFFRLVAKANQAKRDMSDIALWIKDMFSGLGQ